MANMNKFKAKDGSTTDIEMSNSQEQYQPHWLNRESCDKIADLNSQLRAKGLVEVKTRHDLNKLHILAINKAFGLCLDVDEYDFSGKFDRSNPKVKPTSVIADNSNTIEYKIILALLDDRQKKINTKEKEHITIAELKEKLNSAEFAEKLKAKVPTFNFQKIDAVIEQLQTHTAIKKEEFTFEL